MFVVLLSDIDECAEMNRCNGDSTTCNNTEGNFMCECIAGFQRVDEFTCKGRSFIMI